MRTIDARRKVDHVHAILRAGRVVYIGGIAR